MTDTNAQTKVSEIIPIVLSNSDLIVHLRHEEEIILSMAVSCATMRQASSVWDRTLDPGSPMCSVNDGSVTIYGDDPSALRLILAIAHLRTDVVPAEPPGHIDVLRRLAVLCDKYDVNRMIREYILYHYVRKRDWVGHVVKNTGDEDYLFVTDVFGDKKGMKVLAESLAQQFVVDDVVEGENGEYTYTDAKVSRNGEKVDLGLVPQRIIESILSSRYDQFAAIESRFDRLMKKLADGCSSPSASASGYFPLCVEAACDALMDGINNIFGPSGNECFGKSVLGLLDELRTYPPKYYKYKHDYHNCKSKPSECVANLEMQDVQKVVKPPQPNFLSPSAEALRKDFPCDFEAGFEYDSGASWGMYDFDREGDGGAGDGVKSGRRKRRGRKKSIIVRV